MTTEHAFVTGEGMIPINDFSLHNLFNNESYECVGMDFDDFSRESFPPTADFHAFTRILSEIVFGASCDGSGPAEDIPSFVSEIIERNRYTDLKAVDTFSSILTILREHDFKIVEGVDSHEVSKFVSLIEFSETLTE
jgi:hypothetical protein